MKRMLAALLLLHVAAGTLAGSASAQGVPADLDAYVEKTLATFGVPGVGLTVVSNGRVEVARGYGVRELGNDDPVDGRTLFAIASNSKAFTATALALLVEEGKLEWDAPVIRYVPWFRMSDPYVTGQLTVKDLLVHRSGLGLGAGDLLWWPPTTYSRRELAHRLRFLPLATSFRSTYAYDNVLYTVAGELIEEVSGSSWEDFVSSRILTPLGMLHTNVRHSQAGEGQDAAAPHALVDGTLKVIKPFTGDITNPQGGINSCAEDMARWLIVQLDSGRVAHGAKLFSPSTTRRLWTMVTPMPIIAPPPELASLRQTFRGYALGFVLHDYRGALVVSHTGVLPGYLSKVVMVPELKFGIAVLTNQESSDAYESIIYHLLDHTMHAPPNDWIGAYRSYRKRVTTRARQRTVDVSRDSLSHPSLSLRKYAGQYTDAWYGDVAIAEHNDSLTIRCEPTPSLQGELIHWQDDTFLARWYDRELRADALVTFSLTPEGSVDHVTMKAASPETDFSYDFQDLLLKPSGPGK